jgi:hypothetical protein
VLDLRLIHYTDAPLLKLRSDLRVKSTYDFMAVEPPSLADLK